MRFCHAYYCGVDLHARSMFSHVLDHGSATLFARVGVVRIEPASGEARSSKVTMFDGKELYVVGEFEKIVADVQNYLENIRS